MAHSPLRRILTSKPVIFLELAVLMFFGFKLGEQILKERAIQSEIRNLEAEIGKLSGEKDELGDLLEYIKTDAFVRSEAREKLSLGPDGESVLVIPDADSVPGAVPVGEALASAAVAAGGSNAALWWKYFFDYEGMWVE